MCMSQKYKDSPNCRLEGEYCVNRKIAFVPLMMQQGYSPDGWCENFFPPLVFCFLSFFGKWYGFTLTWYRLGIALGAKLWYDFSSDNDWDTKIATLVKGKDSPLSLCIHISFHYRKLIFLKISNWWSWKSRFKFEFANACASHTNKQTGKASCWLDWWWYLSLFYLSCLFVSSFSLCHNVNVADRYTELDESITHWAPLRDTEEAPFQWPCSRRTKGSLQPASAAVFSRCKRYLRCNRHWPNGRDPPGLCCHSQIVAVSYEKYVLYFILFFLRT